MTDPNLYDYDALVQTFSLDQEFKHLSGLPEGRGFNIAHEAIDRHMEGGLKEHIAIRWIRKNRTSKSYTYYDLFQLSNQFANVLTLFGISKGEKICTLLGRVPELYISALGTLKKTAVFCPLSPKIGSEYLHQQLTRAEAKIVVTTMEVYNEKIKPFLNRLPQIHRVVLIDAEANLNDHVLSLPYLMVKASSAFTVPPTRPEDPALLHFTSGATGIPKGVLHVHGAVITPLITGKLVFDFHPDDIYWCTAEPGWITYTSYSLISPLLSGITIIVDEDEFDAARWYSILEEHKVNIWFTAPSALKRLMRMHIAPRKHYNLDDLRLILSEGEALHPGLVQWGEKTFGVPVLGNWSQTETGGIIMSNYRSMPVKYGAMGKPLPGVTAAVAALTNAGVTLITEAGKSGHLVIKRNYPSMFLTYLSDEAHNLHCFSNEWYITGDLVCRDGDGYYWFVGRSDEIIKISGQVTGLYELESMLVEHPAVAEVAVIGKPDGGNAEIVKAFVVLHSKNTDDEALKVDIINHARTKLDHIAAPQEIDFVDHLPKSWNGKVLRRLLKARELNLPEGDLSTLEC